MIVPMKKIFLLILESEKTDALKILRDLGVVHLESISGDSDLLEELRQTKEIVSKSISILPDKKNDVQEGAVSGDRETVLEIAKRIISLAERGKAAEEEISYIRKELDRMEAWGDFNPSDIKYLESKGIKIILAELTDDDIKTLPEEVKIFTVKKRKNLTHAALIVSGSFDIDEINVVTLPEKSRSELETLLKEKIKEKEKYESEIIKLSGASEKLNSLLQDIDAEIEFESVRSGIGMEDKISYLAGYIPAAKSTEIKKTATEHGWGIMLKDPEEEDIVPTLVKNPKAVSIIQPVFDILGIIPGYRERDISFFFLLFLSIFFAMIVGDGGYGLIFLGSSLFFGIKGKRKTGKMSEMILFLIVMSSFTVIWGAVTGTWFGSKTLSTLPFLKVFIVDKIASFSSQDTSALIKHVCFILGTIQISIAHIWNFIDEVKRKPFIRSFAQLGWLSMVNGLYYLVLNFVLDPVKYPVPQFAVYMILGGLAAVVLFSEQEGNFFKGVLKGISSLMTISLSSIGAFSDIISYIRLFAVGLATLAVASSFNAMAAGMGHGVVGIIGSVLILLLGHGLNLAMGALAIIVHGVRLNVLEFSGHLGMEWSGISYDPFRNRKK